MVRAWGCYRVGWRRATVGAGVVSDTAGAGDPLAAVESAAHELADQSAELAGAVAEGADHATGELTSSAVAAINERIAAVEASVQTIRERAGELPGGEAAGAVVDTAADAEGAVAEVVETPIAVTVEKVHEVAPERSFWPRKWPRWF